MFFSLSQVVSSDRKFNESTPQRWFVRYSSPFYKVLKACEDRIYATSDLYKHFHMHTNRGQYKYITCGNLFQVRWAYGYTVVSIGASVIFEIDENTETIYELIDGSVVASEYGHGYNMDRVIAQCIEFIDMVADYHANVYKPEPVEIVEPTWTIRESRGSKPDFKECSETKVVSALLKSTSKKTYWWFIDMVDYSYGASMIDTGRIPVAYQVEIDGVVAWLPSSLIGKYESPFSQYSKSAEISVPKWWYEKNIKK